MTCTSEKETNNADHGNRLFGQVHNFCRAFLRRDFILYCWLYEYDVLSFARESSSYCSQKTVHNIRGFCHYLRATALCFRKRLPCLRKIVLYLFKRAIISERELPSTFTYPTSVSCGMRWYAVIWKYVM